MNRYKTLAANTIILGLGQFGSKFLVILMMGFYQAALGTTGYGEINNIIDIITATNDKSLNLSKGIF